MILGVGLAMSYPRPINPGILGNERQNNNRIPGLGRQQFSFTNSFTGVKERKLFMIGHEGTY